MAKNDRIGFLKASYAPKVGIIHALELLLPHEMTGQEKGLKCCYSMSWRVQLEKSGVGGLMWQKVTSTKGFHIILSIQLCE